MVGAEHLSAKAQPGLTLAGSAEYSSKVGIKCAVSAAPEIRALPDSCQSARGARLRRAPWPDAMSSHGAGRKRHHLPPILSPSVLCYEGDAAWGGGALSLPAPPGWDMGPGLELTCKQGEALSPGRALARGGHCDVSGPAGSCGVKDVNFCLARSSHLLWPGKVPFYLELVSAMAALPWGVQQEGGVGPPHAQGVGSCCPHVALGGVGLRSSTLAVPLRPTSRSPT